jgi:Secretion system C-terminal sorting domain
MKRFILLALLFASFSAVAQREFNADFQNGQTVYRASNGQSIMVYPNPATEYIALNDNEIVGKIVLINLVGKRVRTFNYHKGEIYNVQDLPDGLYLMQLYDINGRVLSSTRINKR